MRSYTPWCHGFLTGVYDSVTPATLQLVAKYTMHPTRPIEVKYHVVDVPMTSLVE
jgi:hypothetical protein